MTKPWMEENVRTLRSIVGVDELTAAALLDRRILVSPDSRPGSLQLTAYVTALLGRTFSVVDRDPTPDARYAGEVVIGGAGRRLSADVPAVFVAIDPDGVSVGLTGAAHRARVGECHALILFIGACYVAALMTKRLVPELAAPQASIRVSTAELLGSDVPHLGTPLEIGDVHLAGAGAVGNAFVVAMSTIDVGGTLHVCDPDAVSPGNLNRCLAFEPGDVNSKKVDVLCRRMQPHFERLSLVPFPKRLEEFPASPDGRTFRRLVIAADSRRARRELQLEFPREVYDASTTGIEEVVLHFNRLPLTAACVSCVYHREGRESAHEQHVAESLGVSIDDVRQRWISVAAADRIARRYPNVPRSRIEGEAYDTLFRTLCAEQVLRLDGERQVLAPFSFVSALAGGLLALEFVRRIARGDAMAPFNYWRASPWASPVIPMRQTRMPRPGCEFCGNEVYGDAARQLWG